MTNSSHQSGALVRTRVELYLPGGRKFTLTLRGRGFELLKVAPAVR